MNFVMLLPTVFSILSSIGLGAFSIPFLIVLIMLGLIIIILIKLFIVLIPAIIVAIIIYFITGGDLFWTGIAFLVVALLSIIAKI